MLAGWAFGSIAAFAVYDIRRDGTVFMTSVHAVFLNPVFLLAGAYLGVYGLYLLVVRTLSSWRGREGKGSD
ncbi:hypothetical protein J31TS4_22970 [Paenibacillus sp. J31TS4]|nr:hypothetical protein J31TS4_22970 [Paenibacillus sp. J31TS4]